MDLTNKKKGNENASDHSTIYDSTRFFLLLFNDKFRIEPRIPYLNLFLLTYHQKRQTLLYLDKFGDTMAQEDHRKY